MKNSSNNLLMGVVYPLPKNILVRLFKIKKPIFIKFLPREIGKKSKSKLTSMNKMYFYESSSERKIVGQGDIEKMESFSLNEIPKKYFERIILKKNELNDYCSKRISKKMVLFHLHNIKKYDVPHKLAKPLTMAGAYLFEDQIEK